MMVDLNLLRASELKDTPAGALFIPIVERGEHFLAGRINDDPVLVVLDGERPFLCNDTPTWSRAGGLVVTEGRFQVDPTSAIPVRGPSDAPLGSIVLGNAGAMIISNLRESARAVLLAGGEGPTVIEKGDVAFATWRLVTGEGESITVHFEHPLLLGA